MSLIFDKFPTGARALEFMDSIQQRYGLQGTAFNTALEAFEHDPFPFELDPPIIHIDRSDDVNVEDAVIKSVRRYGGRFAGT